MKNSKIQTLINNKINLLTTTEQSFAQYVIEYPEKLTEISTIANLSKESGFSVGSIVRFTKKLGFEGYSEFKFFIANNIIDIDANDNQNYLDSLLSIYVQEMTLIKNQLNLDDVNNLVDKLKNSDTILIVGKNNSYTAAKQFQLRLNRMGYKAISFEDESTIFNYTDILKPNDLVVLFSISGHGSSEYSSIIEGFQNNDIPLSLITMDKNSDIYNLANDSIYIPNKSIAKNHMALDGQILFLFIVDILIHKIANN